MKITLLSFLILLVVGCQGGNTLSDQIKRIIDSECKLSSNCNISLQEITNFKWDKVAIFQVGSTNMEISKALGVEYKGSTDLMTGMIFVLKNKIVYEERIPYQSEHPTNLQIFIDKKTGDPNYVIITFDNSVIQGSKEKIEGVAFYSIHTKIE